MNRYLTPFCLRDPEYRKRGMPEKPPDMHHRTASCSSSTSTPETGRNETALFFMGCYADYIWTRASSSEVDSVAMGNRRYFPRTDVKRPLATLAGGGLPKTSASPLSLMLF
ncbi:hypothetical protein MTO96_024943 [Rhipicephalus appendiculatus]